MIKTNKYLTLFLITLFIVFVLLWLLGLIIKSTFYVFTIAYLLNIVNTLLAIKLFDRSIKGSNKLFLINVLGGMGLRILFLLICILLIIKLLNIDKYLFIFTFFIIYFILLVFEIVYYNLKLKIKKINVDN